VITADDIRDCTECQSAGSVFCGRCQVRYAGYDAAPAPPLRFADVIDEIRLIASLVGSEHEGARDAVVHACLRAEALLTALKDQFKQDVVGAPAGPS
jgi:hypothetical protein